MRATRPREHLVLLIRPGKREASWRHFANDLAVANMGQRQELTDISERGQSLILIRFQEGHDAVSGLSQISQEGRGHPFAIHNETCVCRFPPSLFITSQSLWQSHGQMLV